MGFNSETILIGGRIMIGKTQTNQYYFRASYYDEKTGKRIRKYQAGFAKKKKQEFKSKNF